MKIACIGTVGVPASYGGFETLVDQLIESDDARFTVYCSSGHYSKKIKSYKNADLVYVPIKANGILSLCYDMVCIIHAVVTGHKALLLLGVSGAFMLPMLRLFPAIKVVSNLDGVEWRREKWGRFAKYTLRLLEFIAVKCSHTIISDNAAIADYVRSQYGKNSVTIAYGGDHVKTPAVVDSFSQESHSLVSDSFALAICRVEPENNIHVILEAFAAVEMRLVVIGNWENSSYGSDLYAMYKDLDGITLLGPEYSLARLYRYRSSCSLYVHGHSAGGTNPSLVEAMHFGKPIVAFDCVFNRASLEGKGSFFSNAPDLVNLLSTPSVMETGKEILEVAERRYTWSEIRNQYLALFVPPQDEALT